MSKSEKRFNKILFWEGFVKKVLLWLSATFIPEGFRVPLGMADCYFTKLQLIHKTRGLDSLIKYNKLVRSAVYSYLSGSKQTSISNLSLTKDGLPKCLGPLLEIVRKGKVSVETSPYYLRWVLTLLSSTRALNSGTNPNYKSITTPSNYRESQEDLSFVREFWKEFGFNSKFQDKSSKPVRFTKFHLSTKSGPNGQAMYTSIAEIAILPKKLWDSIKTVGGEVLNSKLLTLEKHLVPLMKLLRLGTATSYRKITFFPDREDKVRVIAILDYWSQCALRPLHNYIFHRCLKRLPQDCTFNQGEFVKKLKPGLYYSIDLKDATDRVPIKLIKSVLLGRFNEDYCNSWEDILIGYPFERTEGEPISYAAGNPLGAYSSWATFALTHHFLVYVASRLSKINWNTLNYVLLGDDLVIGNQVVAEKYIELLNKYDIPISVSKTHVSTEMYEFAKRIIFKGIEISPFPIAGLREVMTRYNTLATFLISVCDKGWRSQLSMNDVVSCFYGQVMNLRSKRRNELGGKAQSVEAITKVILKLISAVEGLTTFLQANNIPMFNKLEITEELANHQFKLAALTLFADSNSEERVKSGKPLGQLAVELVLEITNPESPFLCDFDLIQSIPILGVHGQIEELYLNLQKTARKIDIDEGGDWPLFMKSLTLPLSDQVYVLRNHDILPRYSAMMGQKISDQIKGLRMYYDK